jgi:hypothetical protein
MAFSNLPAAIPCCCPTLFFLAGGLAAAGYGLKEYRLVKKIEDTPTSKIRSAAVGLVEIKGRARCKDVLASPISGVKCAYYHVSAEYLHRSKNSDNWITFYSDSSSKQFYMEDDTGKMLLDPAGGQVSIKPDFSSSGNLSGKALFGLIGVKQLDKKVLDFLEANPTIKAAFQQHSGTTIRVYEYYIEDGDELYALGTAEPIPGASSAIGNENLLLHKGRGEGYMLVSDSQESRIVGSRKTTALISLGAGLLMAAAGLLGVLLSLSVLAL